MNLIPRDEVDVSALKTGDVIYSTEVRKMFYELVPNGIRLEGGFEAQDEIYEQAVVTTAAHINIGNRFCVYWNLEQAIPPSADEHNGYAIKNEKVARMLYPELVDYEYGIYG